MTNNILKYTSIFLCITILCSFVLSSFASADTDGFVSGYEFPDDIEFDDLYASIMLFNNNTLPSDFNIYNLKASYPYVTVFFKDAHYWREPPVYFLLFSNCPVQMYSDLVFFDDLGFDGELDFKLFRIDNYSQIVVKNQTGYNNNSGLIGSYNSVKEFPMSVDVSSSTTYKLWSNKLYSGGQYHSNILGWSNAPQDINYSVEIIRDNLFNGEIRTYIDLVIDEHQLRVDYPVLTVNGVMEGLSFDDYYSRLDFNTNIVKHHYIYYLDNLIASYSANENITFERFFAQGIYIYNGIELGVYDLGKDLNYNYRFINGDSEYSPEDIINNYYSYFESVGGNYVKLDIIGGNAVLHTSSSGWWLEGADINGIAFREKYNIVFIPYDFNSLSFNYEKLNALFEQYDIVVFNCDEQSLADIYGSFKPTFWQTLRDFFLNDISSFVFDLAYHIAPYEPSASAHTCDVFVYATDSYFMKKLYYGIGYNTEEIINFEAKWIVQDRALKDFMHNLDKIYLPDIATFLKSINLKLDNLPNFFQAIMYKLDSMVDDIPILYDDIYIPKIIIIFKDLYDSIKETLVISFDDVYRLCTYDYLDSSGNLSLPFNTNIPTPPLLEGAQ